MFRHALAAPAAVVAVGASLVPDDAFARRGGGGYRGGGFHGGGAHFRGGAVHAGRVGVAGRGYGVAGRGYGYRPIPVVRSRVRRFAEVFIAEPRTVRRLALWQQEPTAIMADTIAAATRTNTAPGSARVSIRIERANSGALGGKGLMRPGLGQLIGRPPRSEPAGSPRAMHIL